MSIKKVYQKKKVITDQNYENYWKLTVEYTDIYDSRFNNTLRMICDYIDGHPGLYSKEKYKELQGIISSVYNVRDDASTRKSINQFVKLGFVFPGLTGYQKMCKSFLNETNEEKKRAIFGEIFYEHASFSSSVTNNNTSQNEVKFLLKTLAYHPDKKLTREDLIGLMVTHNISSKTKGYLSDIELKEQYEYSKTIGFERDKYNQIGYLFNFLNYVPNISASRSEGICFVNPEDVEIDTTRDPIRYSIYRTNLKEESKRVFGKEVCYVEQEFYKGLVSSHIKDSKVCLSNGDIESAYNYENGLLLAPHIDSYFDKYDISFDERGKLIANQAAFRDNTAFYERLISTSLEPRLIYQERMKFMEWHRTQFLKKLNSKDNSDVIDFSLNPNYGVLNVAEKKVEYNEKK